MVAKKGFNKEKFKSVVHYILNQTTNKNAYKTHLYKILYFADFDFYEKYSKLITDETYLKWDNGPVPKHIKYVLEELERDDKIKLIRKKISNQKEAIKYLSLEEPKYNLTSEEIKTIDSAIDKCCSMTANALSDYSHKDTPWKLGKHNKNLDPELVFYRAPMYSVVENEDC